MKLLAVSALSAWLRCPLQFYHTYVLAKEEPPKDVMILGLIKHKLHEMITQGEQRIITTLTQHDNIQERFQSSFTNILQSIIAKHRYALARVNVPLLTAYRSAHPIVVHEARERTERIAPLLANGMSGDDLWQTLMPKIKSEYSIKSETLGLKGRIDKLECYPDKLIPIELKSGNPPEIGVWEGHRIQAVSYALLLEDEFKTTVPEAIVQYVDHHSRRSVILDSFLREQVVQVAKAARNCLESQTIPSGCAKPNCSYCTMPTS